MESAIQKPSKAANKALLVSSKNSSEAARKYKRLIENAIKDVTSIKKKMKKKSEIKCNTRKNKSIELKINQFIFCILIHGYLTLTRIKDKKKCTHLQFQFCCVINLTNHCHCRLFKAH